MELILKSSAQHNDWNPIMFDKKYFDNINLKSSVIYNGVSYVVPYDQASLGKMVEFGSVSVIGNDIDSVSKQVLEIDNSIECFGLTFAEIIQAKHDKLDFVKNNINTIINFINEKLSDNEFINDEVCCYDTQFTGKIFKVENNKIITLEIKSFINEMAQYIHDLYFDDDKENDLFYYEDREEFDYFW